MGVVGVGGSEALGVAGAAPLFRDARFALPPSFAGFPFWGMVLLPGVGVGGFAFAKDGDSPGAWGRPVWDGGGWGGGGICVCGFCGGGAGVPCIIACCLICYQLIKVLGGQITGFIC